MVDRQIVVSKTSNREDWWSKLGDVKHLQPADKSRKCSQPASDYLGHIIDNYDSLAGQTLFVHSDAAEQCGDLVRKIESLPVDADYYRFSDHLAIEETDSTTRSIFEKLFGVQTAVPGFLAYPSGCAFAVSRRRIRSNPIDVYRRAKQLVDSADNGARLAQPHWNRMFADPSPNRGIVTAADSNIFRDLQYLVQSLRSVDDHPLVVYDLGLRHYQLEWCLSQPNVVCRPLPRLSRSMANYVGQHRWQAWLKPAYIWDAPFDQILWIDADCVVLSPLGKLFDEITRSPLLMPEVAPGCGANHAALYLQHLPVDDAGRCESVEINNGVIGFDRWRDEGLINAWLYAVQWAIENPALRHLIRWYDQGSLLWAVLKTRKECHIRDDQKWNFPALPNRQLLTHAIRNGFNVVDAIRDMHPGAGVVHWFGLCKLSVAIDLEINQIFANRDHCGPTYPQAG